MGGKNTHKQEHDTNTNTPSDADTDTLVDIGQINPSELSDDVLDELVKNGDMDPDEAEQHAERVQLQELEIQDPEKHSLKQILQQTTNQLLQYVPTNTNNTQPTIHATITNVIPVDNTTVTLVITHNQVTNNITIPTESQEFANLIEYANVETPNELPGTQLLIKQPFPETIPSHNIQYYIPHNTSWIGLKRFHTYTQLRKLEQTIYSPQLEHVLIDKFTETLTIATLISLLSVLIPLIIFNEQTSLIDNLIMFLGFSTPAFIILATLTLIITYSILYTILTITRGNFYTLN